MFEKIAAVASSSWECIGRVVRTERKTHRDFLDKPRLPSGGSSPRCNLRDGANSCLPHRGRLPSRGLDPQGGPGGTTQALTVQNGDETSLVGRPPRRRRYRGS